MLYYYEFYYLVISFRIVGKRIIKYFLIAISVLPGLVLFLGILIYTPFVQDFIVKKASRYVSENMGIELSVNRLRLKFPIKLSIEGATAILPENDTLAHIGILETEIKLWPLIHQDIIVRHFELSDTKAHYADTLSAMDLKATIGNLSLSTDTVSLKKESAYIPGINLSGADVKLTLGESAPIPDTTESAPVKWKFIVDKLNLNNIRFSMSSFPDIALLSADLDTGTIHYCNVDLGEQSVLSDKVEIEKGNYAFLTDTSVTAATPHTEPVSQDTLPIQPWIIAVNRIEITDNALQYGIVQGLPSKGLDLNHIQLSRLNVTVDSIYNRGNIVRADIANVSFKERSGLDLQSMQGLFNMDTLQLSLCDFDLKTANSRVTADIQSGIGITEMRPDTPLDIQLSADLNIQEIAMLYPIEDYISADITKQTLRIDGIFSGLLDNLNIKETKAVMPDYFSLTANGSVRSISAPEHIAGNIDLNADFKQPDIFKSLLDTILQKRIDLPPMNLSAQAEMEQGIYTLPSLTLTTGGKTLSAKGKFNLTTEEYTAGIQCDSFPVFLFLPADSLGYLTFNAATEGQGFAPYDSITVNKTSLSLNQADYNGYSYQNIGFQAELSQNRLSGILSSQNDALQLALGLDGSLTKEKQKIQVKGDIGLFSPYLMHLTKEDIGASFALDITASADSTKSYALETILDNIKIYDKGTTLKLQKLLLSAMTDKEKTQAELTSGDLKFDLQISSSIDTLITQIDSTLSAISRQIAISDIDAEEINEKLPPFELNISAGTNNIVNDYLHTLGTGFYKFAMNATSAPEIPLNSKISVQQFSSQGVLIDTIQAGVYRNGKQLDYYLQLSNKSSNKNALGYIALNGYAVRNKASLNALQHTKQGNVNFDVGLQAALKDSAVTVNFTKNPIIGLQTWQVNPDNYLTYNFDKKIETDIKLSHADQHLWLLSEKMQNMPEGSIRMNIANINLDSLLSIIPGIPPIEGGLNSDIVFGMQGNFIAANGSIGIDGLDFNNHLVGDLGLTAKYQITETTGQEMGLQIFLNEANIVSVTGQLDTTINANIDIPGIPLDALNAFLPSGTGKLSGTLKGNVFGQGASPETVKLNGKLFFDQTAVDVSMIGTSFKISGDTIPIRNNIINFNNFSIIAPNQKALTIDGNVNMGDFSDMSVDLTANASDFQIINVARYNGSDVFGKANIDLNASINGPMDELSIRGNASLLNGTEATYILQSSSSMSIDDQQQNVVTFVSFADSVTIYGKQAASKLNIGGIDMLMNVTISPNVKMGIYLSDNGQNQISLQGGGNLTYTMNRLGDNRFTGRYVLTGGIVQYKPPVISEKKFTITNGSYVEWNGDIADPVMNITATETLHTSITSENQNTQQVDFDIIIKIKNGLNDLSITFDLAAPNNLTIQNQLTAMTQEERSTQAMNLLIYNTYTGDGTTAKANNSNPLNSFIQRELNKWAQNNLKGVDLSFGVNTYDTNTAEGTNTQTDYSYKLSKKLFNEHVRVVVGGKFSTGADPNENLKENLIDDISLEYIFSKRDNMFVKVFRQNNYESILEGEITETGFGFVVQKKLAKLKDLFRLTKDKEAQEKRKAKREIRKNKRNHIETETVRPAADENTTKNE